MKRIKNVWIFHHTLAVIWAENFMNALRRVGTSPRPPCASCVAMRCAIWINPFGVRVGSFFQAFRKDGCVVVLGRAPMA